MHPTNRQHEFSSCAERAVHTWTPAAAAAAAHAASRAWLDAEFGTVRAGTLTMMVTHHAPSRRSIAPPYDGDWLSPAFASNLDELITGHRPDAWIHGYTHDPAEYDLGHTAVVCPGDPDRRQGRIRGGDAGAPIRWQSRRLRRQRPLPRFDRSLLN